MTSKHSKDFIFVQMTDVQFGLFAALSGADKQRIEAAALRRLIIRPSPKITGFVNSTDDFYDQPKVINPASEMISSLFENSGKHTRAAVSTNSLPLGAAVEIDAIFETE